MRKAILFTAAITMLAVSTTQVEAGRRNRIFRQSRQPIFNTTNNRGGNLFDRLMELERRKNAWLFGR